MQSLISLAMASMLLAGSLQAEDSPRQESLQQLVEDRNAAIALSLERKVDIQLENSLRDYLRSRPAGAMAEVPVIAGNPLLAAR